MDQKNTGIIATIAAVLLCGCPGLLSLCMGFMFAVISRIPGADIDVFGSGDPQRALTFGISGICVGVLFVAVPVAVGYFMLRKKPDAEPVSNEPIPPAI